MKMDHGERPRCGISSKLQKCRVGVWISILMDRNSVLKSLQEENLEKFLQKVPVKKGDIFFIPSGQIHAICAGCLVAEVQGKFEPDLSPL